MNAFRRSVAAWAVGLLTCGLASAVGESPENGAESKGLGFKISSWGEWKGPELFVKNDSNWKKIELLDLGYTESLPFKRGEPVILVRKTQTDKGEQYLPYLTVPIAANCLQPLLILIADGKGGAKSMVVDLDPKNFPWGSYKFVNFSQAHLAGMVNQTLFKLEPGKDYMFDPKKSENNRLAIQVKTNNGETSEIIYSNMVINRPSKRMILFFHPSAGTSGEVKIESRCLVDFRQE